MNNQSIDEKISAELFQELIKKGVFMETQEAGFGGKKSEFHPGLNPERKTAGQYLVTLPDGSTLRADSLQGTIEALEDYRRNQGN